MEEKWKEVKFEGKITNAKIINNEYSIEVSLILESKEESEYKRKYIKKILNSSVKISRINIIKDRSAIEIFVLKENLKGTQEYIEKYFPIIRASKLTLLDGFLMYIPENIEQRKFKVMLMDAIKSGLSDFRAQRMDPSLNKEGMLCFSEGMKPAVGMTAIELKEKAEKFMPEKGSRLGTKKERIAFLGVLIKHLVEKEGYAVSKAWEMVCQGSKDLGHYRNSKDSDRKLEFTGSRLVGEWYDLGNTTKIITDDESKEFLYANGNLTHYDYDWPLMYFQSVIDEDEKENLATGWMVLPAA